jgi:hypothetical protein
MWHCTVPQIATDIMEEPAASTTRAEMSVTTYETTRCDNPKNKWKMIMIC